VLLDFAEDHRGNYNLIAPDLRPLADYLSRGEVNAVYADYWIAYALAAHTDEEIVATPFVRAEVRYQPYEKTVKATGGDEVYVLFRHSLAHDAFRSRVEQLQLDHRREEVSDFSVYWLDRRSDVGDDTLRAPPG
jgi:hypothetical protein